jgi:hypothetical protein
VSIKPSVAANENRGSYRRYLTPTQFIEAIAPTEEGFNRIKREQYSVCESLVTNR